MVTVYCDESDDGVTYALAGWIASPTGWDGFTPAWHDMLGRHPMPDGARMPAFHAAEIVERDNISDSRFKGWTFQQEVAAFTDACDILIDKKYCGLMHRIGVSQTFPMGAKGVTAKDRDQYAWLFLFERLLMLLLRSLPAFNGINFVFDNKEVVRERVHTFFYQAYRQFETVAPGKLVDPAVAFRSDEVVLPLQAADLLAYEWRKRTSDRILRPAKATRKSYLRIKEGRPGFMQCYGPVEMAKVLRRVQSGESLHDAVEAAEPTED